MHARFGLEGLVSKRRDRPYQAGRSKHWVKVKNRKHPAMERLVGQLYRANGSGR
jgi:ATP-dependent DNA ligase